MLSKIVIFAGLLAVAVCAPAAPEPVAIVGQDSDISPDGSFRWSFESADGTRQEQSGVPKPVEKDEVAEVVQGAVVFTDPEGVKHEFTYVADENGFQPQGSDIPTPPPIPAQIARALDYIETHYHPEDDK